ncbi:uncharacterized protein [Anabrus simplex]|uniref:uncharacterized protein n=1 Tax=Anabrus simplex TaxID=316456 RepID=UPI0034DD606B
MWCFSYLPVYVVAAMWFSGSVTDAFGKSGPYELKFRRIEHCQDEGTQEFKYHEKLNKVSKYEYSYNGEIVIPDNSKLGLVALFYKKRDNGWGTPIYRINSEHACSDLKKSIPDTFDRFTKEYMGVENTCPVKSGKYNAENWIMKIDRLPMETMEYGEYKVAADLVRDGEKVGCMNLYLDVEKKRD